MKYKRGLLLLVAFIFLVGSMLALPAPSHAVPPVVKTVPWVAANPLIPHDSWSGKEITLKGTSDVDGAGITYTWDFGDGSPVATGTVTNKYVIEAKHTYVGTPGDIFTARLTVQNTGGETASKEYFVAILDQALEVEVNVAIDEGLWYLHKTQTRTTSGGIDIGSWNSGAAGTGWYSNTAANVNAFEVNGHQASGSSNNPYTETVARGLNRVLQFLSPIFIGPQALGDPDTNGNGIGLTVNQSYRGYQTGMLLDAIVASGTPTATAATGDATWVAGRQYQDIVQDIMDFYFWAQYDDPARGGWRYNQNEFPDNSACQWAAIGLIAGEREWGLTVPQWVKDANLNWLAYSQHPAGYFGYTSSSPVWGVYAVTPSGMVQLAMDGAGRGQLLWDRAENYMRNAFCNTGGAGNAVRDYYYGLFSFTKSMLLHDSNGDGVAEPIEFLANQPGGANPLDWYGAQTAAGDLCDGVARTLVNDQNAAGYWYGHNYSGDQYPFETAWAIIMLNRTVFSSGVPVAVAEAIPNPAVAGQVITLDGSASFHQDPSKSIDSWEWDLDDDGEFDDASGPVVTTSFPALGNYFVGLRVTDNADPEGSDTTTITVQITTPPVAPTADANGPYVFCPQTQPWFLDGTGSVNPDEGQSIPPNPGDTIQEYAWDLDGDLDYDDAFGAQPDVTADFSAQGVGAYLIRLRVTDTTSTSYPGLNPPFDQDLSDTDSAQVFVKAASDPACAGCIDDLAARPKSGKVQLTWAHTGAVSYNVYRSTVSGGPYAKIANTTSTYSTYLDTGVTNGTTYYYVVRPAALNGDELCQSNEASATPTARIR